MSRPGPGARLRERLAQGFTTVEDVLYVGLGVVLSVAGIALLVNAAVEFTRRLTGGGVPATVASVLDQLLLVLMIIEILYTVLVPEPFVLVALIAAVRRILVITAEFGSLMDQRGEGAVRYAMIELGLLTVMAGVLGGCLVGLRKRDKEAVAERA